MLINYILNGKPFTCDAEHDLTLFDLLKSNDIHSVKCGCETSNCGLCTVWIDNQPMLSCSVLAIRINNKEIITLEGKKEETQKLKFFIAEQGVDQCGFCSSGFIMNVMKLPHDLGFSPSDEEIKLYLGGNLCRCTGYAGQLRAIRNYLEFLKGAENE